VPSIIYVQLGSSHGGIVVNLGLDGIACLTAARLPSEKNLSFDMKLRGAGLNVELTGEVVWLGATQKKTGIRFKNLSPEARKEISDWIARESQLFGPVGMDSVSPMDSIGGFSADGQNHTSRPFSVPPAVAPANSASPNDHEHAATPESTYKLPSDALLKSRVVAARNAPAAPISPSQPPSASAWNPARLDAVLNAGSSASENEFHEAPRPQNDALFDPLPIEKPYQFPRQKFSPAGAPENATSPALELPLKAEPAKTEETKVGRMPSVEASSAPVAFPRKAEAVAGEKPRPAGVPADKSEPAKTIASGPVRAPAAAASMAPVAISQEEPAPAKTPAAKSDISKAEDIAASVPGSAQNAPPAIDALASIAAYLWIPPVLREAWNRGDRTQRWLMASLGVACVGSFLLVLILTIWHVSGPSGRPTQNASPEPTSASTVAANDSDPAAESSAPSAANPDHPPPSPFMSVVNLVFGIRSEPNMRLAIDRAHGAVEVWTSKTSGYYYCTDSEYYKLVQPGSFMNQRDALQNGYQPKLAKFCE
jgi:Na+-transporting methylmalonyl-CoA/oxaloacetate decarboxylase gamma subunit